MWKKSSAAFSTRDGLAWGAGVDEKLTHEYNLAPKILVEKERIQNEQIHINSSKSHYS